VATKRRIVRCGEPQSGSIIPSQSSTRGRFTFRTAKLGSCYPRMRRSERRGSRSHSTARRVRPSRPIIVRRNFGAFTAGSSGAGPAIATNYISEASQPLNTIFQPARPGQMVTLWGTGLGPVTGDESARALPGDLYLSLQVMVGGVTDTPLYQGRSGCCAGLDQIIFPVPAGVEGCYVPVVVRAGTLVREGQPPPAEGAVTATATISVSSSDGPCNDPPWTACRGPARSPDQGQYSNGLVVG